ncbi:MAG: substrate-binding domain-containing protein [Bacteroidota bacterium]
MKEATIAGVPEHFNLPWHLALEEGALEDRGLEVTWLDVPEGTGRMCELLNNRTVDMAVVLTEGALRHAAKGNPLVILQEYVGSPLLWGIHVAAQSEHEQLRDLKDAPIAVSRIGSGSHLMAMVHVQSLGWSTDSLDFRIINHLDGAVAYLRENPEAYFLWEHYTTKPLVEQGHFKRLGDFPTPWPCFVIVAHPEFVKTRQGVIRHTLETINRYSKEIKDIPSIDRTFSNRYGQELEEIQAWLSTTEWSQSQISKETLQEVTERLRSLKVLEQPLDIESLLYQA